MYISLGHGYCTNLRHPYGEILPEGSELIVPSESVSYPNGKSIYESLLEFFNQQRVELMETCPSQGKIKSTLPENIYNGLAKHVRTLSGSNDLVNWAFVVKCNENTNVSRFIDSFSSHLSNDYNRWCCIYDFDGQRDKLIIDGETIWHIEFGAENG